MSPKQADLETREALLAAARALFLDKGLAATSVAEVCAQAGLTKGAFFHYFASKDAVAEAVLARWVGDGAAVYGNAPFLALADPLDRLIGYIDFTIEISKLAPPGCLVGAFSQELWATHPAIRAMCDGAFRGWADGVAQLLDAARTAYPPRVAFDTSSLAYHFVAVFEGAQILARATGNTDAVEQHLGHFKDYVQQLFAGPPRRAGRSNQDTS